MHHAASRSLARRRCGVVASLLGALVCTVAGAAPQLDKLRVPAGFRVELLTDAVPNARQMALGRHDGSQGVVYVGSSAGKVYAVQYGPGARVTVHTVASGLQLPTGVAWREGALFVGASARVLRFEPSAASRRRRRRSSSPRASRRRRTTDAASSPSAPTASSTYRSVRRATSACPTIVTA
jgi:glucose/arabinose dehydrogenase